MLQFTKQIQHRPVNMPKQKTDQPRRKNTAAEMAECVVNAAGGTVSDFAKEMAKKAENGEISYDEAIKRITQKHLGLDKAAG
jgi:hypothetical protein